jgi:capsular polysaccharide biosynthesis protein
MESLHAFNKASRVILPIGSAKFNLLFCRPGTLVICVAPKGYSALSGGVSTMLRHLCHAVGLKLAFYDVEIVEQRMLVNSDMRMTESDIEEIMDVFDAMA